MPAPGFAAPGVGSWSPTEWSSLPPALATSVADPTAAVLAPRVPDRRYHVKYAVERAVAALLLVLFAPIILLCAAVVMLRVGGPPIFTQERVGINGRHFRIYKLRSLRSDEVDDLARLPKGIAPGGLCSACRTRTGRFLRKTSLDELPQLLNVLRGEMSLVGPRPERPKHVKVFSEEIPRYADRLRVRPGITGLAQVQGLRGRTSLADRVERDNFYIENWSPLLDAKILLLTLRDVARLAGE